MGKHGSEKTHVLPYFTKPSAHESKYGSVALQNFGALSRIQNTYVF